jgi:PAS domain S-box-containing protein
MSVKILVVEDESIVAMDIKHRLETMGYNVLAAVSSGETAVEKAGELKPDLILMDIVLKGQIDGIDAYNLIKENYNIPLIFLTAYSDEKTVNRAKTTSPYGYIIKPFEDRELKCAIEVALYKHEMESKLKVNEEKYRYLFEGLTDAIFITFTDYKFQDFNPAMLELFGYNTEEMENQSLLDLFADCSEFEKFQNEINEKGQLKNYEIKFLDKEKNEIYCTATVSLRINDEGTILGYYGFLNDVTEHKKTLDALRGSEAKYRKMAEKLTDGCKDVI